MKGDRANTYAINNHYAYFKIARDSQGQAARLQEEYERWESQQPEKITTAEELTARVDWMGKRENPCIISVVFAALAIEAYINSYATTNMSKNHFETYYDKLDLTAKWIVIPKVVTGNALDPGSTAIQSLRWLVALRNRLVHSKATSVTFDPQKPTRLEIKGKIPDQVTVEDAKKAIETVRGLMQALRGIDSQASDAWLIDYETG